MMIQSTLMEMLARNRGYDDEFLDELERGSGGTLPLHVDEACALLRDAYVRNEPIGFIPDFDMDGIMSGCIGFAGLAELGFNVHLYRPDIGRGYGFDGKDVDAFLAQYPDIKVLVTADVGVSCRDGVARARELGLRVLVTDHHRVEAGLPDADVVVDPMLPGDPYYNPHICGAHVIYQVLARYSELYGSRFEQAQIRRLRVFAAIGTVSDSMPMHYNNRGLVRDGIAIARLVYSNGNEFIVDNMQGCAAYKRAFRGLYLVLAGFADAGKISGPGSIDEDFFGYYMAPTFNSVKRMGGDSELAFGVFFGNRPSADAEALMALNETRKVQVNAHMEEILDQDNPYEPYIYFTTAAPGLRGLLATKLMRPASGPCIVLSRTEDGRFEGSGRSPSWFPFLTETEDMRRASVVQVGADDGTDGDGAASGQFFAAGHENAFGIGFDDMEKVGRFAEWLARRANDKAVALGPDAFKVVPDFVIAPDGSGDIDLDIVAFAEFLDELQGFRPFGPGFEGPNILLRFKAREADWAAIGKEKQHLRIKLGLGFEVLCWNQAFRAEEFSGNDEVRVWGKLNLNEFRDRQTMQFIGSIE